MTNATGTMTVTTPKCMGCGLTSTIEVPVGAFLSWQRGELIQNAFPNWTPDKRELLKTGWHSLCWDRMFGDDE